MDNRENSGDRSAQASKWQANAASSMRLALLSQLFVQGLSLVAISVQMRLVPKADFGVFGLAVLLVEFPRMLTTMGVGAAVVQKNDIRDSELSFLFWLNQVFGVLAMLASVLAAPLLMQPGDPAGLFPVTLALASGSIFAALARVPQAILEREMKIALIARAQWISMGVASALSIALGFAGFRIWALVAHQWLELVIFSIALWPQVAWRPGRPSFAGFSADLFHYANAFTLSQWIHWLGQRFDRYWLWRLLAGTSLGLEWLGLYTQIMNLILRPALMITGPLTGILLSVLSRTYGDKRVLESLHRSVLRLAAITLCPICLGLIATSEESLYLLGGEKWRPAGLLLAAMGLIMITRASINLSVIALSASGKSRMILGGAVAASLVLVASAVIATSVFDQPFASPQRTTLVVAMSQTLATAVFTLLPFHYLCSRALGTPFSSLVSPWGKALAASVAMGGVVWAARQWLVTVDVIPILGRLSILVLLGATVYGACMLPDLRWAHAFLRRGRFGTPKTSEA